MKWVWIAAIIILIMVPVAVIIKYQSPLQNITDYRIYYGAVDDVILEDMKRYDMVVVEALHFDKTMVENLKTAGVKVIGYISVSEVGNWDNQMLDQLSSEDFIKQDGRMIVNGKNNLGDLSSTYFRTVVLSTVENRIIDMGMDGIFFDTLDTIDLIKDDEVRLSQAKGYINLVEDIRVKWDGLILIQNRGFNYTYLLERGMVDAVLWENFSYDMLDKERYKQRANELRWLKWMDNVRTMALSYHDEDASRAAARKKGWLFSYLNGQEGLVEWQELLGQNRE